MTDEENRDKLRERRKRYYEKNRDKAREYQKRYREENRDKVREIEKRYREENRDKAREYQKRYYEKNRDKKREYRKRYYEENRDKVREIEKRYYEGNRDKVRESQKRYYEGNRDKVRECKKRYREENRHGYIVYFIRAENTNSIKIGITNNIRQRLIDLQIGSASKLKKIAEIKCNDREHAIETEKWFHDRFKTARTHGEWFEIVDGSKEYKLMLEVVKENNGTTKFKQQELF